jgi:hypothetical protein
MCLDDTVLGGTLHELLRLLTLSDFKPFVFLWNFLRIEVQFCWEDMCRHRPVACLSCLLRIPEIVDHTNLRDNRTLV